MRYAVFFSYDGTNYHGWQYQPNAVTVQQRLEEALAVVLRHRVSVTGAGRTATGVHARQMACHLDVDYQLDTGHLAYRLNSVLPPDIAVDRVERVADDWHARFSATSRTYHIYISTRKDTCNNKYALRLYFPLDMELMNRAADMLLDHQDFGCFCKSHSDNKTNICHITHARWTLQPGGVMCFRITANRFLRNMVRAIVGTLIEVGKHRMTLDQFRQVLQSGQRTQAGESVPACGLCLEEIVYGETAVPDDGVE